MGAAIQRGRSQHYTGNSIVSPPRTLQVTKPAGRSSRLHTLPDTALAGPCLRRYWRMVVKLLSGPAVPIAGKQCLFHHRPQLACRGASLPTEDLKSHLMRRLATRTIRILPRLIPHCSTPKVLFSGEPATEACLGNSLLAVWRAWPLLLLPSTQCSNWEPGDVLLVKLAEFCNCPRAGVCFKDSEFLIPN